MANRITMSIEKMENGAYRATFIVEGDMERSVIAITRTQALDRAFSEIRKIILKTS